MSMKLVRFRVTNFRSVADSGWLDVENVTALIGANESGKTNLLLPLWKLNPAKEGAITPVSDYPRKDYTELRHLKPQPVFVAAVFKADDGLAAELAAATGAAPELIRESSIARKAFSMSSRASAGINVNQSRTCTCSSAGSRWTSTSEVPRSSRQPMSQEPSCLGRCST